MTGLTKAERLTALTRQLVADGVDVTHRELRDFAVNGLIPAHQVNHIWHAYRDDYAKIADAVRQRMSSVTRKAA